MARRESNYQEKRKTSLKIMIKNNSEKGKFFVIEGIDGAGTETQSKLIFDYLRKKKRSVVRIAYPDRKGLVGKLIYSYLEEGKDISLPVQFLLHLTDFVKDQNQIKKWLKEGKVVISDRYFTSTLVYQGIKGFSLKKALSVARNFDILKPDLVVFLKVSPETSTIRKLREKNKLDRNESDKILLQKASDYYYKLAKRQIFAKWLIINGENSVNNVFGEIKKKLNL